MGNCDCIDRNRNYDEDEEIVNRQSYEQKYDPKPLSRTAIPEHYNYEERSNHKYNKASKGSILKEPDLDAIKGNYEAEQQPDDNDEDFQILRAPIVEDQGENNLFDREKSKNHPISLTDGRNNNETFHPKAQQEQPKNAEPEDQVEGQKEREIVPARKRPENYLLKHPLKQSELISMKKGYEEKSNEQDVRRKDSQIRKPVKDEEPLIQERQPEQSEQPALVKTKTMKNIMEQKIEDIKFDNQAEMDFVSKHITHAKETRLSFHFQEGTS